MTPFSKLRSTLASDGGPIVVAHRGDSGNWPENTLAAFRAAVTLGVRMQEFDVHATRDGQLVCLHDEGLDRTTDAARRLGPGALVWHTDAAQLRQLDAGSWRGAQHAGQQVPTLSEALAAMLPSCIPMIEHKSGGVERYAAAIAGVGDDVIVQSFDWSFLAAFRSVAPAVALAVLGPTPEHSHFDARTVDAAVGLGVGMMHWRDRDITAEAVALAHARGLLVCSYTTDDELGWAGGRMLGIDAMCTNQPTRMLTWRRSAPPPPRLTSP
jgi:glycerophosphoryl diester phosphodiesterase